MKFDPAYILYLGISLSEIFFFMTTILSITVLSFYVNAFTQIPYNDIYDSRYAGIPISSAFLSLASIIYLSVYFILKLDEKYLIGFAVISLVPNILNLSYIGLVTPDHVEEGYNIFTGKFHELESIQRWAKTIGKCCNLTSDPTYGMVPGNRPACDNKILLSVQNRFVVPYKCMKVFSILRFIAYIILVIAFVLEYVIRRKCKKEED
jgi:hypothetical protein